MELVTQEQSQVRCQETGCVGWCTAYETYKRVAVELQISFPANDMFS